MGIRDRLRKGVFSMRLVVVFLLMALVPVIVVSYLNFVAARDFLRDAKLEELEAIADLKLGAIESFHSSLVNEVEKTQAFYVVRNKLPILVQNVDESDGSEYREAEKVLDGQLLPIREINQYIDYLLFDTEGRLVYTTEFSHPDSDLGKPLPARANVAVLEGKKGVFVSDIFESDFAESGFEILVSGPVYGDGDELMGMVAFGIDMGPVYESIQDVIGLGETGETLIGRYRVAGEGTLELDFDHAVFLNTLRHDPEAALERYVEIGSDQALPIQEAVQGKKGTGLSIDYRGEEVLATWRFVPVFGWGMVAKIDSEEAFAPAIDLRNQLVIILGVVVVVILLITFLLARNIARRRKAEGKVLELNKLLKLLNKILRHDILNDVTIVENSIKLYATSKEEELLSDMDTAMKRSKSTIDKMKDLESAVSSGGELVSVDVVKVVDGVKGAFPKMKINVDGQGEIMADQAFGSVIENLVRNAKVHAGVESVDVLIRESSGMVEIRVADQGKGIPDEVQSKLSEEGFKYGDTGNTGLGLYIVRKTVERYGGTFSVENNKPKGVVFVLRLVGVAGLARKMKSSLSSISK